MLNLTCIDIVEDDLAGYSHLWTDEELYEKYGLTEKEKEFIESTITAMI